MSATTITVNAYGSTDYNVYPHMQLLVGGVVVGEWDVSGTAQNYTVNLQTSAAHYYHADHLSNRLITDATGSVYAHMGHFPYGESWYAVSTTTKWQYTSYERDAESNNDYAMARYYVNRLGRMSSPDLIAGSQNNPQSLNRYTYVGNDPINSVDPSGLIKSNPGEGGSIPGEMYGPQDCIPLMYRRPNPFDAEYSEIQWEDVLSTMCVPPARALTSQTGGTSGRGGPYTTPGAAAAREAVNSILSSDNPCSKWLNAATAASTSGEYLSAGALFSQVDIRKYTDARGTVGATTVQDSGDEGPIFLNSIGPFYAVFSASSGTKAMKVGPYTGGSLQAQTTILLHELAHKVDAAVPDAKDETASANNTQTVLNNCQRQIDALR
jgi:RHS repeat-associated protein